MLSDLGRILADVGRIVAELDQVSPFSFAKNNVRFEHSDGVRTCHPMIPVPSHGNFARHRARAAHRSMELNIGALACCLAKFVCGTSTGQNPEKWAAHAR